MIELLVVITIIAVLVSLLFPTFTSTKKAGERSVCINNLSQFYKSTLLYSADSDDMLPRAVSLDTQAEINRGRFNPSGFTQAMIEEAKLAPDIKSALSRYGTAQTQWKCPADSVPEVLVRDGTKRSWYEELGSSYGYEDAAAFRNLSLSGTSEPGRWILFATLGGFYSPDKHGLEGRSQLVAFDGHVQLVTGIQLVERDLSTTFETE